MLGVKEDRRAPVAHREAQKLRRRLADLGIQATVKRREDAASAEEDSDDGSARASLLTETLPNTEKVFDLIDRLAGEKMQCAYDPDLGLRGSVGGLTPRLGRKVDQITGTRHKAVWMEDGTYNCLCPLALAAGQDDELTEADLDEIHAAPHNAARTQATATGAKTQSDWFDEQNTAWGLLVAVSDGVPTEDWTVENLEGATDATLALAEETRRKLEQYAIQRLEPAEPTTLDYDSIS